MKHWGGNHVFHERLHHMICTTLLRWMLPSIGVYVFFAAVLSPDQTNSAHLVPANEASTKRPAIVIGFVGGFVAHDNLVHSEVQLAARLRKEYPKGVDVETFESYRGGKAKQEILKLLDTNHDGILAVEEKQNAQIIIYGHSWGGIHLFGARAGKGWHPCAPYPSSG